MVKNRFSGVCACENATGPIWMLTRTADTAKASFVMALSIVAEEENSAFEHAGQLQQADRLNIMDVSPCAYPVVVRDGFSVRHTDPGSFCMCRTTSGVRGERH